MIGQLQKNFKRKNLIRIGIYLLKASGVATVTLVVARAIFSLFISVINHEGVGVMRKFFSSLVIGFLMLMMTLSYAWAQISLKDLSVNYNELRLDKGYSIIYDNPNAAAKLNEFKIKFYKDATFVDETVVETFPLNGTILPYGLTNPVIGFNKAELSIISLHSGDIIDFPSSAASIIALNEPTKIKPTELEPTPTKTTKSVNKPPLANDVVFEVDATREILTRSIADQFSDPDEDIVSVVNISKEGPPLSYAMSSNGTLTLSAPSITGTYIFPYTVKDSQEASASADITVAVAFPEAMSSEIVENVASIEELLSQISNQKTELLNLPAVSEAMKSRRENLLMDNKALEKHKALKDQTDDPTLLTLKGDIANLTVELEASKNALSVDAILTNIENLESQSLALQNVLQALKAVSYTHLTLPTKA